MIHASWALARGLRAPRPWAKIGSPACSSAPQRCLSSRCWPPCPYRPLSWVVGLIYIGYDTWLLGHMVRTGRRGPSAPALVLGPLEFLGRLATLIPHPGGATSVDAGPGDQRGKLPR